MTRFLASFVLAAAMLIAAEARAGGPERPVLVELFTSQGCSSCPPAEAYAAELAERDDVVVVSMHVNYWDYIGWADPFASEETTARQREYGRRLGRGRVYTPQMVIDGRFEVVGSRRAAVADAIARARRGGGLALAIDLALRSDDELRVTIPGAHFDGKATVWLLRYDAERVTEVTRGENAGRTLRNVNVVRELDAVGMWTGLPLEISLPASALTTGDGSDGCVIVVQEDGFGRVLGARRLMLARESD